VFNELAVLGLNQVNSAFEPYTKSIKTVAGAVRQALDLLDRYADWCPAKWREDFDRIRGIVGQLVSAVDDAKVSREELDGLVDLFRVEYARLMA
jgi:hypothetical protein